MQHSPNERRDASKSRNVLITETICPAVTTSEGNISGCNYTLHCNQYTEVMCTHMRKVLITQSIECGATKANLDSQPEAYAIMKQDYRNHTDLEAIKQ